MRCFLGGFSTFLPPILLFPLLLSIPPLLLAVPAQESLHAENIFHSPVGTVVLHASRSAVSAVAFSHAPLPPPPHPLPLSPQKSFFWPRQLHVPVQTDSIRLCVFGSRIFSPRCSQMRPPPSPSPSVLNCLGMQTSAKTRRCGGNWQTQTTANWSKCWGAPATVQATS